MTRQTTRLVSVAWIALAASAAQAATCGLTGEPEVDYNTLVAASASAAYVVSGDCKPTTVATQPDGYLDVADQDIERVLSVPSGVAFISTVGNRLSRGADFSMATKATKLSMSGIPVDTRKLALPPSLQSVDVGGRTADLASLEGVSFPGSLISLTIKESLMTSMKNVQLPASLQYLEIVNTPLTTVDFQLPAALKEISLRSLRLASIDRLVLPSRLETFKVYRSGTVSIRGVRWPASLRNLDFSETTAKAFEIRQSDVAILENLDTFIMTVTQASCSGTASLERVFRYNLCVLSDADFDRLYGGGTGGGANGAGISPTPTSSRRPTSSTNANGAKETTSGASKSSGGSNDGATNEDPSDNGVSTASASSEGSRGRSQANSSGSSFNNSPAAATPNGSTTGGDDASPSASRRPGRPGDSPEDIAAGAESSSRSSIGIVVIVLISVLAVIVGLVLYRVIIAKRRRKERDADDGATGGKYTSGTTPTTVSDRFASQDVGSRSLADSALIFDFRDDRDLLRCRIHQVTIGERIARGGYGIVYRGSYQGRVVAIKQMLPDTWRNDSMTADFVDEIRMCTRLNHPKIVEFIGVSWTGVRDLSAVSEFMDGGDLHSIVHKYSESTGHEWVTSWTPSSLRNKTLIALDVVEALVYLHSFETPIIHRDLKTKNVLLDLVGNAKLSDFGISREMTVDETMTSEVGTAAWIAPEVLRGERYGEKADIYSLGVLLVEMDRCSHPYANDPALLGAASSYYTPGRMNSSRVAHKNTQIAILVSTGKLKPTPTLACPLNVASLIARCLIFDASERPTAVEVLHALQRICESQQAAA